jgi:hypothetical protein
MGRFPNWGAGVSGEIGGVPYVAVGNDELGAPLKKGDLVDCKCGGKHPLELGVNTDTKKESDAIMFYKCGDQLFVGGLMGRAMPKR